MIKIEGLEKSFRFHKKRAGFVGSIEALFWRKWQEKKALQNVNLKIEEGELVGLLGANGAGKTTLVKVCSGIIHPTSGSVRVMGFDPWQRKNEFRHQIALIMGQKAQLWWDLPAADCFLLLREIYRIDKKSFDARVEELAHILDVGKYLDVQIRRLSLGERMKVELIAALLHQPRVIFLDEPTIGLDISSQRALRRFILDYHRKNSPIMMLTSHYMEDIESLCRRIIIMREGQIVYDGGLRELIDRYASHKFLNVTLGVDVDGGGNAISARTYRMLSDIDPDLQDQWGEIADTQSTAIRIKVLKEKASLVSSAVLQRLNVADLNISDVDVGTIVSQIQGDFGGRH